MTAADSAPLAAGAVVAGYRLEQMLGEGGMGVVWSAVEVASGRKVALKLLRERRADAKSHERFLREARAAMTVAHPNIAKVEALLEADDGTPVIVMELLEGESFRAVLRKKGTLTPAECATYLVPVIDAIAAAHGRGVIHRDLKPENVFVTSAGEIRVLDFGIAKQLPRGDDTAELSLTSTGTLVGTPVYMAPEQVYADADVDGRVDVWSLGIILYECLAGVRPTDGDGFGPILKRITREPLVSLDHARRGLPLKLTELVDQMLQRDRELRPSLPYARAVLLSPGEARAGADAHAETVREVDPKATLSTAGAVVAPERTIVKTSPAKRYVAAGVVVAALAGATVYGAYRANRQVPFAKDPEVERRRAAGAAAYEAARAVQARDARACTKWFEEHDRLDPSAPSSVPESPIATSRASCFMLAGDCRRGRALYEAGYMRLAGSTQTPEALAASADGTIEMNCEGDDLDPRDEILVAANRLEQVAAGIRTASVAECKRWLGSVERLSSVVKPRSDTDWKMIGLSKSAYMAAMSCHTRANDCAGAFEVHRKRTPREKNEDAATYEARLRRLFASDTSCPAPP